LRNQIADTTSDYDREKLEERLAKLSGGIAVIRVGAPSGFRPLFGDRPENQAFKPGSSMRTDNEQISLHAVRATQALDLRQPTDESGVNHVPLV
jgi:hypothetical protein